METNLLIEGLKFMILGMGTVFIFLIVMIAFMYTMSTLINKFFPEPQMSVDIPENTQSDNKKIVAAITAVIAHHNKRVKG